MTDDFKDIITQLDRPDSGAVKITVPRAARFNMLFSPYRCLIQNERGEKIALGSFSFSVWKRWEYYGDTREPCILAGNYVDTARGCSILTGGEHFNERVFNISTQYSKIFRKTKATSDCYSLGPIKIGHGAIISHGAIIRSGISIGNGAVIGAGAVVVDDVPDFAVVVGNPGKVIKYRFTPPQIENINKSRWWDLKPSHLFAQMETINQLADKPVTFPAEHYMPAEQSMMVIGVIKKGQSQFAAEFLGVIKEGQFTPKEKLSRLLQFYHQQTQLPDNAPAFVLEDIFTREAGA